MNTRLTIKRISLLELKRGCCQYESSLYKGDHLESSQSLLEMPIEYAQLARKVDDSAE